ncbi:hypothetical protein XOC_4377 [Xanthomonas oryzae pv. oryzicola BLS256]|uniref:Uncharacterized protein n=1 Tax=Xanthomonas oryzae pv. oryzicola (strain BLS256) TaxID=383407 RepID=G7TM92_XANOB|nr:hypothetical protein XOC_4377 [Xanthomonas oryzae pv. oryzicola BLS256]
MYAISNVSPSGDSVSGATPVPYCHSRMVCGDNDARQASRLAALGYRQ